MYDRREETFGIWSDTIGAEFSNLELFVSSAEGMVHPSQSPN
jgi:hypothetical protein